jgi:hypothetical protein
MSVILDSRFATAEDTAAALGVSDARLKRLIRVAGPKAKAERVLTTVHFTTRSNGKWKRAASSASRRKQTRGKTKKAAH